MEWLTYYRTDKASITRKDTEIKPYGYFQTRPATDAEIQTELLRREERERQLKVINDFTERPEYQDATQIRSILEFMTPENHPLDRLTPEEWRLLLNKLKGS